MTALVSKLSPSLQPTSPGISILIMKVVVMVQQIASSFPPCEMLCRRCSTSTTNKGVIVVALTQEKTDVVVVVVVGVFASETSIINITAMRVDDAVVATTEVRV